MQIVKTYFGPKFSRDIISSYSRIYWIFITLKLFVWAFESPRILSFNFRPEMLRPGYLDFAPLTKNRLKNKNGRFKKRQNWKSSPSRKMTISKKILSTGSKPRFYSRWAARPVSSQTRFFTIPVPWVTKISGAGLTDDMLEGKKYLYTSSFIIRTDNIKQSLFFYLPSKINR